MKRSIAVAMLFFFVLLASPVSAQDRFADVTIKTIPVAGNVYMLEGAGGNIGVSVGSDGMLIVDDQFAELSDRIRAALSKLGEGKLHWVLNTHYHGDHTGGNANFSGEATIVAHDNVRKRLGTPQQRRGQTIDPAPDEALPMLTFSDQISIHFNDDELRVIHFARCHTDGDSVIFFRKANVVHMGDMFFAGRFPFVDRDAGGSVAGLTKSIADLLARMPSDAKIIPGHGSVSTPDDLRVYHTMLVETAAHVAGKVKAGESLERIKKAGFPPKWDGWGSGFISAERWIETLHAEATAP